MSASDLYSVMTCFDLTPAQKEQAIRERLIQLGWTPPSEHATEGCVVDGFELLPLPDGESSSFGNYKVYDGEMMVKYTLANVARAIAPLQAEIEALRTEVTEWKRIAAAHDGKLQRAVPPGYALVPVEPTIAMCIAGDAARFNESDPTRTAPIYRAMLAAAPKVT